MVLSTIKFSTYCLQGIIINLSVLLLLLFLILLLFFTPPFIMILLFIFIFVNNTTFLQSLIISSRYIHISHLNSYFYLNLLILNVFVMFLSSLHNFSCAIYTFPYYLFITLPLLYSIAHNRSVVQDDVFSVSLFSLPILPFLSLHFFLLSLHSPIMCFYIIDFFLASSLLPEIFSFVFLSFSFLLSVLFYHLHLI